MNDPPPGTATWHDTTHISPCCLDTGEAEVLASIQEMAEGTVEVIYSSISWKPICNSHPMKKR